MTPRMSWLAAASALTLLTACASASTPPPVAEAPTPAPAPPPAPERPKPEFGTFGFDVSGMDTSVAAGDDFFRHANGKWVDRTEIPADRSSYTTFAVLAEKAAVRTRKIIEESASANAPEGSEVRKIGDYFSSFMDEARIEQLGASPIKPQLAKIDAIKTRQDLSREIGASIRADVDALNATNFYTDRLFGLWVAEDLNDTSKYRPYLMQGGLGMPDREYYTDASPRSVELRGKYEAHIAKMLTLAGYADAAARAKRVVALETAIAKTHWSVDQTADVQKANVVWTRAELARKAPGLDWEAFLAASGLADQQRFGAWQDTAIAGISKLVGGQPIQAWKDYLAYHALKQGAPYLSKAFVGSPGTELEFAL